MAYRWKKSKVLEAVAGSNGILSNIANNLGITLQTLRRMRQRWPELEDAIQNEARKPVHQAEAVLHRCLESEDEKTALSAAKYLLSTLGKDLGYTTRQEISADVQGGGSVVIFLPDNGRDLPAGAKDAGGTRIESG